MESLRTWRLMKRSPPYQAAPSASKPGMKATHGRYPKYMSTHAGDMARNTIPTSLTRKLEKWFIR
jgi:hypothetical protein